MPTLLSCQGEKLPLNSPPRLKLRVPHRFCVVPTARALRVQPTEALRVD